MGNGIPRKSTSPKVEEKAKQTGFQELKHDILDNLDQLKESMKNTKPISIEKKDKKVKPTRRTAHQRNAQMKKQLAWLKEETNALFDIQIIASAINTEYKRLGGK